MTAGADLILAVDQGTSSTRAIAFDAGFREVAASSRPLRASYPRPGWVEQDAEEILATVVDSVADILRSVGGHRRIVAVGLDNQGETVVAWDALTFRALAPAVVWQCRRSESVVARLRATGLEPEIRARTGLPLDPYFSAGKVTWMLEHLPVVRRAARRGTLRVGTVDAWLTARLGDRGALTDPSTASRTQLLSLRSAAWDDDLLEWFGIERAWLPDVVASMGPAGSLSHPEWGGSVPLAALACDQQAALAGHGGFARGAMKATYGTGVFVLANIGEQVDAVDGLETSIAWVGPDGHRAAVVQGGVFTAGALISYLHESLGLADSASDTEAAARRVPDSAGVRVLPALAGLGAPFYDSTARGIIAGLTAAAGRDHIVRAALDGIAHRTADVVEAVVERGGISPKVLRIDGGLTANGYLVERQADLLGMPVVVSGTTDASGLGTGILAAIGSGRLSINDVAGLIPSGRTVEPRITVAARQAERSAWRAFVDTARKL